MFRLFVFRLFSDGFVVDILDKEETINKGHHTNQIIFFNKIYNLYTDFFKL